MLDALIQIAAWLGLLIVVLGAWPRGGRGDT
jgi:hypothetical protein